MESTRSQQPTLTKEVPILDSQMREIGKVLSCGHDVCGRLEAFADRLLNSAPRPVGETQNSPGPQSIEAKLGSLHATALSLTDRLAQLAERLDRAA